MAESTQTNTIARETVEELASRLSEPSWLTRARLASWEAYLGLPAPTSRDESWRRTDIQLLDLTGLSTLCVPPATEVKVRPELPAAFAQTGQSVGEFAGVIVSATGSDGVSWLNEKFKSKGVIFCDIATAAAQHADKIEPYLAAVSNSAEDGKFALLTSALFNCGMFLYLPAGVEISEPFFYGIDWSRDTTSGVALLPMIVVVAEERSAASVITAEISDGKASLGKRSLLAMHSRINIKPSASVKMLDVSCLAKDIFFIGRSNTFIERDGRFESLSLALGGGQVKQDLSSRLTAPGASTEYLGVVLGAGSEKYSFNTICDHESTDTRSNINFRVALKDESTSVYQGIVKVAKVAQRTDAYQSNKNLLLSSRAKADSIPKLEILADDVKCSHGATVGPVDAEQLFYLQSRGLEAGQAEELVVLGFFRQVLEAFSLKSPLNWLSSLVSAKMHMGDDDARAEQFFSELDLELDEE